MPGRLKKNQGLPIFEDEKTKKDFVIMPATSSGPDLRYINAYEPNLHVYLENLKLTLDHPWEFSHNYLQMHLQKLLNYLQKS